MYIVEAVDLLNFHGLRSSMLRQLHFLIYIFQTICPDFKLLKSAKQFTK